MNALMPLVTAEAGGRGVLGPIVGALLFLLFGWTMWRATRARGYRDDDYDQLYDDREPDVRVDPDQDN